MTIKELIMSVSEMKNTDTDLPDHIELYHDLEYALNVLKIIKHNQVDVFCEIYECSSYQEYKQLFWNNGFFNSDRIMLTSEEFTFLRNWFVAEAGNQKKADDDFESRIWEPYQTLCEEFVAECRKHPTEPVDAIPEAKAKADELTNYENFFKKYFNYNEFNPVDKGE